MLRLPSPPSWRAVQSVVLFGLLMALLLISRPAAVFRPDGSPRPFGTAPGTDATLLSLGVVTVLAAVLSLFVFAFIDATFPS